MMWIDCSWSFESRCISFIRSTLINIDCSRAGKIQWMTIRCEFAHLFECTISADPFNFSVQSRRNAISQIPFQVLWYLLTSPIKGEFPILSVTQFECDRRPVTMPAKTLHHILCTSQPYEFDSPWEWRDRLIPHNETLGSTICFTRNWALYSSISRWQVSGLKSRRISGALTYSEQILINIVPSSKVSSLSSILLLCLDDLRAMRRHRAVIGWFAENEFQSFAS
jgi:hypothetical protein